jgi:gliding motility-associated-like protein
VYRNSHNREEYALKRWITYYCLLMFLLNGTKSKAQNGLGAPIYLQNFGQGGVNPLTRGPALPKGRTDFVYSDLACPAEGTYTIIRRVSPGSCFGGEWIDLTRDNTPNMDFGMMMLVNNNDSDTDRVVYADTVKAVFCSTITYRFSTAVINVDEPLGCASGDDFPLFEYRIENQAGQLIKKDTTRPAIRYASKAFGYKFSTMGFDFQVPAGTIAIVAKIRLLHRTYWCGEDFAIDDVMIAPLGPGLRYSFDNEPATIVKSLCYQQAGTIFMSGSIDPYYVHPALQWQQSTDSGFSWSDIPNANALTYSKMFNQPDTFLFRLTAAEDYNIANPACRVVSNVMTVQIDGPPKGYTISSNSPVCSGKNLQFDAKGAAKYEWHGPNGFYDNVSYAHIYKSRLKDSGWYYVDITSLGGCTIRDSTYARIIGTDVYVKPAYVQLCAGQSVQLEASQGISYSWSPSTGLSTATTRSPKASPTTSSLYVVQVTDAAGCSDTAKAYVSMRNEKPVKASIQANTSICPFLDSLQFAASYQGDQLSYQWDFGNGQQSAAAQPAIQFYRLNPATMGIKSRLVATDYAGCADTAYHVLEVAKNCHIEVPTAFTPNGDGKNEYLYPLNAFRTKSIRFRVFNRYGQPVFESSDGGRKWDGNINGMPQPTGVYVWMLDYTDTNGNKFSMKGTSVLIR